MGDVARSNTGNGVFTGRKPHISLNQMKGSSNKRVNKDLITGSWVTQNDLQGRNTLGAIASGSGFESGEEQFLFGTYSFKTRVDKKGRSKATLFDDTDRDGIIDRGETKIGSFKADINAVNNLVEFDAAAGYYIANGYIQLNTNNGRLSIFDAAGGDLLGIGKLTQAGLNIYLVPSVDVFA